MKPSEFLAKYPKEIWELYNTDDTVNTVVHMACHHNWTERDFFTYLAVAQARQRQHMLKSYTDHMSTCLPAVIRLDVKASETPEQAEARRLRQEWGIYG